MRSDISDYLIHFTKGDDIDDAFNNLRNIVQQARIGGSSNKIRGGYNCVCFSEAPLSSLTSGLINPDFYSPYSPFGILTTKQVVFDGGGRPVIYQTEEEYDPLDEEHRWRHVLYDLHRVPPIDFTWEREWRIKTNAFILNPRFVNIVVPEKKWADNLILEHEQNEKWKVYRYKQIMEESLAVQYAEPFSWNITVLNET